MNKEKIKLLNNSNKNLAKRFYKDLSCIVKEDKEKQEVYLDFLNMLCDCQIKNIPSEEIIPNYSEFFETTVCNLDKRNKIEKFAIKHKNFLTIFTSFILVLTITYCFLSFSGAIGVWSKGLEYISQSNKYSYTSKKIDFNKNIDLDLKDLSNNNGKIIYDDGINKLFIKSVDLIYITNTEEKIIYYNYSITIISEGVANYKKGSFISNTKYDDILVTYDASIKFLIEEKECVSYNSHQILMDFKTTTFLEFSISQGNLNEKLSEDEEMRLQALVELESITISFSDMYLNEWIRK